MGTVRARPISSSTFIRGPFIEETLSVFRAWDFSLSNSENFRRLREENTIGAASREWASKVAGALTSRYDPNGSERALVELAKAGMAPPLWKPLLLWHLARREFLVRELLTDWLYGQFKAGAYLLSSEAVMDYLTILRGRKGLRWFGAWGEETTRRVASGFLKLGTDFGLLEGNTVKKFASFHLPEECFLYILHAMAETEPNAGRIIASEDWHMFLMDASDVERELLRLHQFRKLRYEVAGSLAQLTLPCASTAEYVRGLCS